jgi:hypothetical protein
MFFNPPFMGLNKQFYDIYPSLRRKAGQEVNLTGKYPSFLRKPESMGGTATGYRPCRYDVMKSFTVGIENQAEADVRSFTITVFPCWEKDTDFKKARKKQTENKY